MTVEFLSASRFVSWTILIHIIRKQAFYYFGNVPSCVHAYANDTQLYLSFKPQSTPTEEESIAAKENCIKSIRAGMIINKMKTNDIMSEFLTIGMKQQLNKVNITTLSVGDSAV